MRQGGINLAYFSLVVPSTGLLMHLRGKMEMSRQPHMQACERREEAMRKGSDLILTLVTSQND